jgi:uncharacterized protein YceK
MRRAIYLFIMILLLTGCKSSKQATSTKLPAETKYLSAKMQITAPMQSGTVTLNGTLKLKSSDRVQLSVLMPILRTELVRMEVCPEYCMLVDRMNRQYVVMTKEEMAKSLPSGMTYSRLENLLVSSAAAAGRYELSGKDMGLPSLEKAKVVVYDISDKEFDMTPTTVSSKYTQVSSDEMLDKVKALLQ